MRNLFRKIQLRLSFPHCHTPPVAKRLQEHKIIDRAIAFVLTIVPLDLSRLGRNRKQLLTDQLTRLFIKANDQSFRIERSFVNIEYALLYSNKVIAATKSPSCSFGITHIFSR